MVSLSCPVSSIYIHVLLLCYREWTCSRVQDRCEAPRLSNLRNFASRLQFFFVKVRRQNCGGGPKVTLKSSVPDLIQICSTDNNLYDHLRTIMRKRRLEGLHS